MNHTKPDADRLAELKANRRKREEAEEARRQACELEELELEETYSESLGRRGTDFEIVDFTDQSGGFVVVKRGEAVLHKKFIADMEKAEHGVPQKVLRDYVGPCVAHPSKEKFEELADRLPEAWRRCSNALFTLHGARRKAEAGKF